MFSEGFPQDKQVTYAGMLWLLAAQIVVMAPLVFYLPVWLLPVLVFSAVWRIRAMKGHQQQPGKIIKLVLAVVGLIALSVSGMPLVSLDMMASLLMLGFAYKALEVVQKRDAMVVILTGFVLIGLLFLYSQSILIALYGAFALAILTGAMVAIQQPQSYAIMSNLRLASLMLILCLPLMLLFFVFSPRFAPLWTMPLSAGHAKTGISDSMTPGDIANLSQSDDLAFTVKFLGERPKQSELYWRGLVMQYFDGKTWSQFADRLDPDIAKIRLKTTGASIRNRLIRKGYGRKYEVIYEKTGRPWLFSLTPVVDIEGDAFYGSDYRIMALQDIVEPMMLTLISYPDVIRDMNLESEVRKASLQLPKDENPKTRQLAQILFSQSVTKHEYINKVLKRYQEENYYYTLRPPRLSDSNNIDEFLLQNKKGFCAHYAGSFVFMMRAVGIPARIVTGYQGGKWNEKGEFLSVRQYDAHAWAEVWLENEGWLRFDPTSMVAPNRILKNLEQAVNDEGSFLESKLFSMSKYSWLKSLQSKLDSTQYAWRRFVLGYDNETQSEFLKSLFGTITIQKIAMIVGGFFGVIILLWVAFLRLGRKGTTEAIEHQLYRRFCYLLEKKGVKRELSQVPEAYSQFAISKLPSLTHEITTFTKLYSEICYNPEDITSKDSVKEKIMRLRSLLRTIKKSVSTIKAQY